MLENRTGQEVPNVTFRTRQDHEWQDIATAELFKNKTVIVFSLPGAFTPTCSSTHVPRYNQLTSTFKKLGVDDIICMSVNDGFVMNEWQDSQNADQLTFIPDGNGEFTDGMGMLVNKEDLGFGQRSWRYSMLVKNGVIEKMFIEPEQPGDPFGVSDADSMLDYLAPQAKKPMDVSILTRKDCSYCHTAKELLQNANLDFEELVLNKDYSECSLRAITNSTTVPQIFINGTHIGGSEELAAWLKQQEAA